MHSGPGLCLLAFRSTCRGRKGLYVFIAEAFTNHA